MLFFLAFRSFCVDIHGAASYFTVVSGEWKESESIMTERESASSRKLAAIMVSDIHSFSQKMAENESAALALLKAYDGLMRILTLRFGGTILKSVGDLFLIEFRSAVNAVRCAMEAQQRLSSFNKEKEPLARIEIRIGIHMGDVVVEGNEISGEDVQIASLIEALAEPNRILISHDIYQQARKNFPLQAVSLGKLKLKGISEPIEVHEILLESIPELSVPSKTAEKFQERHTLEAILHRREKEAEEARRIEALRQKAIEEQQRSEEERRQRLEALYQKAEESVQQGNIEEAEETLNEAIRIDSSKQSSYASLLEPNERKIQEHLTKARQYLEQNNFAKAENEINEIFAIDPLHIEAQQVLLHIEEQRYKAEQKARAQQRQENTFLDSSQMKINSLLEQVREHIQKEEFTEARFLLREVYRINPNHYGARQIEEELHAAEEARVERLKLEASKKEEEERQRRLELLRRKLEEQRRRRIIHTRKTETSSRTVPFPVKAAIIGMVIILLGIGVFYALDYFFPSKASIAVLPLAGTTPLESQHPFNKAIPYLLAHDLAQCRNLTVINPTTALLFDRRAEKIGTLARFLNVRYVLAGTATLSGSSYTLTYKLIDADDSSVVNTFTTTVTSASIGTVRAQLAEMILQTLHIKTPTPSFAWTTSVDAANRYLLALYKLPTTEIATLQQCARLCETAFQLDPKFWCAAREAADFSYQAYELSHAPHDKEAAAQYLQKAASLAPSDPHVRILQAKNLRLAGKINDAITILNEVSTTAPSLAVLQEEYTLLSLMQNKPDEAVRFARKALTFAPKNSRTLFLSGIAHQAARMPKDAIAYYNAAIKLGYPETTIMNNYCSYALLEAGEFDTLVNYYTALIQKSPRLYSAYYRLGQAYHWQTQLKEAEQWLTGGLRIVQEFLTRDPEDAEAHAYAALFFSRLGKFSDGESEIQRALELAPQESTVLYAAAATYGIQNEKEKCLSYLRKALETDYRYAERFNPDFASVVQTPEFLSTTMMQ